MGILTFAIMWYNLPFTLSLLAFLGLSLLQLIGLDQGPDADADVDLDYDADLDVETGLEPEIDPDVEPDIDDLLRAAELLQFLGLGQIPITMIFLLLLAGFGTSGWIANSLVIWLIPVYPSWALLPVFGVALLVGIWFTSRMARIMGQVVPVFTTTATSVKRLVTRQGWVISSQVDQTYGQVKLRDAGGTSITVFAVVDPGQPPITRNSKVFLVEYDPVRKLFVVEPTDT